MYTTKKSEIARLRAYRAELEEHLGVALARRDLERARSLQDLRRRVIRAILLHEEFHPSGLGQAPDPAAAERGTGS
jgi:predicted metal-dependent phosphoesterase TrpH